MAENVLLDWISKTPDDQTKITLNENRNSIKTNIFAA